MSIKQSFLNSLTGLFVDQARELVEDEGLAAWDLITGTVVSRVARPGKVILRHDDSYVVLLATAGDPLEVEDDVSNKAKTTKEVLIAAKWILENTGWCQKSFYQTKKGEHRFDISEATDVSAACAIGSIYLVETINCGDQAPCHGGGGCDDYTLRNRAVKALEAALGEPNIALWNDTDDRAKEEVLALFDKAIKNESKVK